MKFANIILRKVLIMENYEWACQALRFETLQLCLLYKSPQMKWKIEGEK
jgi:hypothetical protein